MTYFGGLGINPSLFQSLHFCTIQEGLHAPPVIFETLGMNLLSKAHATVGARKTSACSYHRPRRPHKHKDPTPWHKDPEQGGMRSSTIWRGPRHDVREHFSQQGSKRQLRGNEIPTSTERQRCRPASRPQLRFADDVATVEQIW